MQITLSLEGISRFSLQNKQHILHSITRPALAFREKSSFLPDAKRVFIMEVLQGMSIGN